MSPQARLLLCFPYRTMAWPHFTPAASGRRSSLPGSISRANNWGRSAGRLSAVISPDGKWVAEDRQDPQTGSFHLWVHDLDHGTESRVSTDEISAQYPVWSPDSKFLLYQTLA